MRVRRGVPDDLAGVMALFEAVAAEGVWIGAEAPVEWTPSRLARWGSRLAGDDETGVALVAGESPAHATVGVAPARGDILGWIAADRDWTRAVEFHMLVAPGQRGRGVGGALLDAVVDWARGTGTPRLTCHVWPHNTAALHLYRSRGLTVEGRLRRHWPRSGGQRWDSVLMGLVLDESAPGSPHEDSPLLADLMREGGFRG